MAVNIHWRPDEVPSLSLGAKPARCSDHSGAVTAECTNHYYTLLLSLVYIAVGDGGRAVAKFSKSRVWDKVSDENTLIFGDALISLKYSVG